jgi:glucose-1-phosphate thymidylyltransferase
MSKFESYFQNGRNYNCKIKYYSQPRHLGSAYGLLCARDFIDDDFILIYGNNYFDFELKSYIENFKMHKYDAMLLLKNIENPWEFETATIENGKITGLYEKHRTVNSGSAITGVYFFTPAVLMAASKIKPTNKGEYTLLNTLQYLKSNGNNAGCMEVKSFWISIDKSKDILECNKYLLSKTADKIVIGSESKIINSKIDTYASIGRGCIIKDAQISNSVIMDDCIINGVEIYDSILCEYSIIAGKGSLNGVFAERSKVYLNCSVSDENADD